MRYVAAVLLPFALSAAERKVSIADCRFANDPDSVLERTAGIRNELEARTLRTAARLAAAPARPVDASTIPRRNFIDEEIFARLAEKGVASAPLASDAEFVRRIYLDLTGRLPSPDDVRAFLADTGATRRDTLIDKLLESPEFTDRWTMWMGDLLQNTATLVNAAVNRNVEGRNAFHRYIREAVAGDKSFRTTASEVIAAGGNNYEAASGAANFPLGASTSMGPVQDTYDTMLVRTAGTFLGLGNYDCVLCHNGRGHLELVSVWGVRQTRVGAQSMAAFFSRMAFNPSSPRGSVMVEDTGTGGYELNTDSGNRPNRTPVGSARVLQPAYRETDAPAEGDWRQSFASHMVRDPMFARNLANRIWKQMFGLALVEPVDGLDPARLDPANPPPAPWELQATHPQLLEKLAAELTGEDFRLRAFLRLLARSSAYQLSSRYDGEWNTLSTPLFARHFARRLEGEEVHDAIVKATGVAADYEIRGSGEHVAWAMQLPEPVEPANDPRARNFMNTFLRGDRDTQERSQAGSIQQQLYLMNDPFVIERVNAGRSPKLAVLAEMKDDELVEELYLTFLSRRPSDAERTTARAHLAKAAGRNQAVEDLAWMCINKVEFLFSY